MWLTIICIFNYRKFDNSGLHGCLYSHIHVTNTDAHTHTIKNKKEKMVNSIELLPPMSQREVYLSDMYSITLSADQNASIIYNMIVVLVVSGFHS